MTRIIEIWCVLGCISGSLHFEVLELVVVLLVNLSAILVMMSYAVKRLYLVVKFPVIVMSTGNIGSDSRLRDMEHTIHCAEDELMNIQGPIAARDARIKEVPCYHIRSDGHHALTSLLCVAAGADGGK